MPAKRPRRALDDHPSSSTTPARVSLTHLPIEILAEILLYTCSPPTVVAASRTCAFLYRSLVLNPDASFIWRGVRQTAKVPLHDPVGVWKGREAAYTAFVFGEGVCEVCQKKTREMYLSFSARIRLCGSWHCRQRFLRDMLVNVGSALQGEDYRCLWVPPMESPRCLYPSRVQASFWPRCETLLLKRDWEEFQRDLQTYRDDEKARVEGKEDAQTKCTLERFQAAKQRLSRIMEVSRELIQWKWTYDQEVKAIKKENETWTKNLADIEGWDLEQLVASQAYGSLQRRKNFLLEKIEMKDVMPIQSTIESELLMMRARRQHQMAETTYKDKLTEVKKIYERIRCGTITLPGGSSCADDPLVLPPLSVFCALPSVRALKGSPDPSTLPPGASSSGNDINTPLAISLITADVRTWLIPVQKRLMALLGYPNGWQSASTRAVHPLKRVTTRFFCRRCGEGRVGKGYQRELCLDFTGVCSHVCKGTKKKNGSRTSDWTVDLFVKDEKAISVAKRILGLAGLSDDSTLTDRVLELIGPCIRCKTCQGLIVMDFNAAIGHAHRHDSMEVEFLRTYVPGTATVFKKGENLSVAIPTSRLKFECGTTELLLGPTQRAKKLCAKVDYGCKHCFAVSDCADVAVGFEKPGNKGARAMSFHGLRSHVKEKHGIENIRDEDYFCYTSVLEGDG